MSKVEARYAVTSDADSESSDCNLSYVNSIDECEMRYLEQELVPNNDVSSSEEEINNNNRSDSLPSTNDESDDDRPNVNFVDNGRNVIEFENDAEREEYIIETVREWALEAGYLSMKKLNNLLNRLHIVFPRMPRNYKTLLHTPVHINIVEFDSGCKF